MESVSCEYQQRASKGLVQQGWKDSHDSVFHADGRMAEPPIALCEVQGYVYAAQARRRAACSRVAGTGIRRQAWTKQRKQLRAKFEEAFWCEELGTYALALDGQKKQCRVRTSNAGHALFCKIASEEHAETGASSLMSEHSFCGWGVRTVAACEVPLQSDVLSQRIGLAARQRPDRLGIFALRLADITSPRFWKACMKPAATSSCIACPNCSAGFTRRPGTSGPTLYPVACAPQAWAAGSVYMLLQACLGLERARSRAPNLLHQPELAFES